MNKQEGNYWSDWSDTIREELNPEDIITIKAMIELAAQVGAWDVQIENLKEKGYCNGSTTPPNNIDTV